MRRPDESGAVLVETAIASILLMILIAGIFDYGSLFASNIDVSSAVRSGARAGATATAATGAVDDYTIIHSAIQRPGKTRSNIEKIVVYKADSADSGPPADCVNGTPPPGTACNVYTKSQFTVDAATLNASSAAQGWPAASREPGTDYIGVWVQAERKPFFNIIWSPSKYTESMALRIPPVPPAPTTSGSGWSAGPVGAAPSFTNDEFLCWPGRGCFDDTSGGSSGGSGGGGSG